MLTVRCTPSDGIILMGTDRMMASRIPSTWRWSRACGFWFVPRTRDTVQSRARVDALAAALRAALNLDVVVEFDLSEGVRSAAEREVAAVERGEARIERLEERADKLAQAAGARHDAAARVADMIPLGQPILVGHHSERRHRRDVERIRNNFEKAHELSQAAQAARGAAHVTETRLERQENPGAILRRVDRLEADRRRIERELAGDVEFRTTAELSAPGSLAPSGKYACPDGAPCADPECVAENERRGVLVQRAASGERLDGVKSPSGALLLPVKCFPAAQRRAELEARRSAIVDDVEHLRSKLPADLPGPQSFKKGDTVETGHGPGEVLRVNPKSLTVRVKATYLPESMRTFKIEYDRLARKAASK